MGTQILSRLSQGNSNTQSTGIPIESISTTEDRKLILVDEKKKETLVKYRRDDSHDGPEDTFVVEQNGASKSGLTVEDLRGGDDGEFAVYSQIMGNQAKARPDKFMYSFMSTADNGKAEEDQVTVFTEKTDDGQSRYRIRAELLGGGAVHTSEYMTLEDWKKEEDVYGKEWLDRFEKAIGAQQASEPTELKPASPMMSSGCSEEFKIPKTTSFMTSDKGKSVNVEYWQQENTDHDPRYVILTREEDGKCLREIGKSLEELSKASTGVQEEVYNRIIEEQSQSNEKSKSKRTVSDATKAALRKNFNDWLDNKTDVSDISISQANGIFSATSTAITAY